MKLKKIINEPQSQETEIEKRRLIVLFTVFWRRAHAKKYAFHLLRSAIHAKKHTVQPNR